MKPSTDSFRLRIVESLHLTVQHEDWSQVRSPSRALRRMKQGHRQRVRYIQLPDPNAYRTNDTVYMHPETARAFRRMMGSPDDRRGFATPWEVR